MLNIEVTDLQHFSPCRRQWWLGKSWKSPKPNPNYWFGTAMHNGLEALYKTADIEKSRGVLDQFMLTDLRTFAGEHPDIWESCSQEFDDLYGLCLSVFDNYVLYDQADPLALSYGRVLEVEQTLKYTLFEDDKFGKVSLVGRVDLVLQRDDGIWVVDHKTSGSMPSFAGLDVDEQLTGYAFLLFHKKQILPQGLVYNVLIKDLPNEPKENKDGSLSKDISQKTVYALYTDAMIRKEIDLDNPDYSKILDVLRAKGWSSFFARSSATRNLAELSSFRNHAVRKAHDIVKIFKNPMVEAYPTATNWNCSYCSFLGVCKSMEDGGDWEAILRARFLPADERKF